MATDRTNIGYKFENGDIPSQGDFQEVFNSFIHKDEDKADFQMVETGTDNLHYVTPALLRTGLQNIGIITGNSYMPLKEHFDNFVGNTISLQYAPVNYSVKVFKNGQLLLEKEGEGNDGDYIINYEMAKITFSGNIDNRNIEVDYWYKNLTPNPGGGSGEQIDFTSFLHTSGNETKNGILTFNNTTPTSTSGIVLTNSGADAGAKVLDVTVSGIGSGIAVQNTAAGTGIKVSNTGAGAGLQVNSSSTATGDPLQVSKDNVVKAKIDSEGIVTAKKFVSEGGTAEKFVKGDGSLDPTTYADDTKVIHTSGNETKDGALKLTHNTSVDDVLTIEKNNSANCLKLVQNSSSNATTSTFDTSTDNINRKAISVKKKEVEKAFITHDGNVSGTSFTTLNEKADITDGFLTLAPSDSATAMAGHAKLYAKTDGTTDLYVMGSDGVEKKIGDNSGGDLDNVLHKTGYASETKTGELVIDSGTANVSGLKLNRITQTRNSYATVPSNTYGLISIGNTFYRAGNYLVKIENQVATTIGTGMGAGYSICYNSANNKIYIGGNSSRIRSMDPDGSNNQIVAQFSVGNQNFYGITIASDNNLYVLEYTTGNIHRSTLGGVKTENFANVGSDINSGLISGNNGFIYASHNNTIKKIDIANGVVTDFVTLAKRITSLFLHSDGYIYANTIDSVARILLDGTNLTENWASGLLSPNRAVYGICSQNGELYIADGLAISKLIQPQKALKTDPAGLVVSSTYLEDVQYLKATDLDLSSYSKLTSPNFNGTPTAPTATLGTNTNQLATTAFVMANSGGATSGTYTPIISSSSGILATTIFRSVYTKIGNLITVTCMMSATSDSTGDYTIPITKAFFVSLPFPAQGDSTSVIVIGSNNDTGNNTFTSIIGGGNGNNATEAIINYKTTKSSKNYLQFTITYNIS
ncbi:hypothetical protein [Flavobacterium sp. HJSW_4]|uniref:hypothetical protein n=1 Tax=Flavobacterium sp. HJSW_4 TaxID=3344660 RepID=UPI0035F4B146